MDKKALVLAVRLEKHDPMRILASIADAYVRQYPSEAGRKLAGALRARDVERSLDIADSVAQQQYATPLEHFQQNQLSQLVRKVPLPGLEANQRNAAWKKFLHAEHRCRRINQRFAAERRIGRERYSGLRQIARDWIAKVIGTMPNLDRIYSLCDLGPGASVGVSGLDTSYVRKIEESEWTVTPTALPYARAALWAHAQLREFLCPARGQYYCLDRDAFNDALDSRLVLVGHNKITMVPKTARVHRTIAIEPLWNTYLQKGVDEYFKSRLRRQGIDLSDQSRNQFFAWMGSTEGFNPYATIDLSAASDSLAISVVRDLLPPDWYAFLSNIRSPSYIFEKGQAVRYEKFSSMGNGFCFPLESLIFAALVKAAYAVTGDTEFCVYGDDIIVRQSAALLVIELLGYYGFKTNVDKTFVFGPFKESCGADYFLGTNVRPYTLDFLPVTDRDLIKLHNGMALSDLSREVLKPMRNWLRLAFLADYPCRPHHASEALDDAVAVEADAFLGHWSSVWCRHLQCFKFWRFGDRPVKRAPPKHSAIAMYGALKGAAPDADWKRRSEVEWPVRPLVVLRRKTRTHMRLATALVGLGSA